MALLDERCILLEPTIQESKILGARYAEILANPSPIKKDADEFTAILEKLPQVFDAKIKISEPLLKKHREYLDSWQVRLFTPKATKENLHAQYAKYEADFVSNKLMLELMNNPDNEELTQRLSNAIKKQQQIQDVWDEKFNNLQNSFDIRSIFIQAPEIECIGGDFGSPVADLERVG